MSTIRLESIDSFALQSTRLTGSRLGQPMRHAVKKNDTRSRDRYNVEIRFKGYYISADQTEPSSGTMEIYIGTYAYIADKYLRNSGTTLN